MNLLEMGIDKVLSKDRTDVIIVNVFQSNDFLINCYITNPNLSISTQDGNKSKVEDDNVLCLSTTITEKENIKRFIDKMNSEYNGEPDQSEKLDYTFIDKKTRKDKLSMKGKSIYGPQRGRKQ